MSDIPTRKERTTLGSVVRTPRPVHPGAAQLALDNSASWATEEGSRENVPRKLTPSDQKNSMQEKSRGAGFPPLSVTTGAEKAHTGSSPFPLCSRAGPRGEGFGLALISEWKSPLSQVHNPETFQQTTQRAPVRTCSRQPGHVAGA